MDLEALSQNVCLEEEEFYELFELFIETALQDLHKLETGLGARNVYDVLSASHSLKGAAANFGLEEIRELAEAIEMSAHKKCLDEAAARINTLRVILEQVIDAHKNKEGTTEG
ncbi:MAG: Hpt domain-containing protein [Deltaproteobacteria bacterium]|nr:Hpt domain-containing protein [Deltaproteobacteria bacterium]